MLPGLRGRLVSEYVLESRIAADDGGSDAAAARPALTRLVAWRPRRDRLGPASSVRAIFDEAAAPLAEALGFDPPDGVARVGEALSATFRVGGGAVVLIVAPWGERLDAFWRVAVTEARRQGARWGLAFNGTDWRIVDAGRLHARRFLEFDLDLALDDSRACAALWLVARAAMFAPGQSGTPLHDLVSFSDRHAAGVCRSLRDGVLEASTEILRALVGASRRGTNAGCRLDHAFEQSLTIVYRLLFLLFAEARGLVPLWHAVYRDGYSVEALGAIAERARRPAGLWDALRAMARLAHAGCRAGDLRVTPFNGRLFAPTGTPLADRRHLDDEAARRAVLALSTRPSPQGGGRERIWYRDLGVEQLGAVYETLLDYTPTEVRVDGTAGRQRTAVSLEPGSGVRKATGSFYTPQPIADYLVRRTLGPLVRDAGPDRILALRVVDPAMGSGAFLVAACRYLAAAYESALVATGRCREADFDDAGRAAIRRTIAERCLYGVDVNPMAVQLARLSLWLATLALDRPLTFLDHRLLTGDSLIGAWLTDIGRAPAPVRKRSRPDTSRPLFDTDDVRGALKDALPVRFSLETVSDDTVEQVRAKERALASLSRRGSAIARWKAVADLWCAPWFAPPDRPVPSAAFTALSDAILGGPSALPAAAVDRYLEHAADVAAARRFFHWELEFPEVFFDRDGERSPSAGFDAVIGNPPWDMLRADAGPSSSPAGAAALVRFTRGSGVYAAQSDGHANRYQLFVERTVALTRQGGRIGLVVPSGLATDHGSAPLRRLLFNRCDVDAMVGFDNRRAIFPIHRSVKFLLLTASTGSPTRTIACRLGEQDAASLESVGDEPADTVPWFSVRVTPALLERLTGEELAIPELKDPIDLAIAERAAALFPPLGSDSGWGARFGRELNATDDGGALCPAGGGLPVVEGKLVRPFQVDLGSARYSVSARDARRLLPSAAFEHPRLAYRDVASATNRQTLIAAVLPGGCVSTHTVFCLRTRLPLARQHLLCGLFNSLVVNYLARLRVTTHVTTGIVERLPVPRPDRRPGACLEIAALARLLARKPDVHRWARLNARVAGLYQLSVAEFTHVLGTFPLVPERERELALLAFTTETPRRAV